MKTRVALFLSALITTFVLVLVGSVVSRLSQPAPAALAATADALSSPPAPALADATVAAPTPDQSAAYQQMLDEARTRLDQANQQLTDAYASQSTPIVVPIPAPAAQPAAPPSQSAAPVAQPAAPPASNPSPVQPAAPAVAPAGPAAEPDEPGEHPEEPVAPAAPDLISADQAVAVAVAYLGDPAVERVELEHESNTLVYEVRFASGSRVYVDAYQGVVVYARVEQPKGGDGEHDDDD